MVGFAVGRRNNPPGKGKCPKGKPSPRKKGEVRMRSTFNWVALVVAGVALLIAAVGAILALLAGHARFIEVAWVSIAASLFVLALTSIERRE